jgi:hypothetical protein
MRTLDLNNLPTFGKKFVAEVRDVIVYCYSLEKLVNLGKQFIFYRKKEMELKPIFDLFSPFVIRLELSD